MVSIQVVYNGELRTEATHGPSGHRFTTDAPVDNHGRGEFFSPTDLVGTALATCMVTIMGIAAEKHGWDIRGTTVDVEKHMVADPRRRIAKLEVVIHVPHELGPEARETLERAALTCPVHASLHPDVEIPLRFRWGAE
jgi:putative redox protein